MTLGVTSFALLVSFPEPHDRQVRNDLFRVTGTYLDRSMVNEYPIITDLPED